MPGHADAIRAVYARWAEGDFRTTADYDPAVSFSLTPGFPDSGTYRGMAAIAGYMHDFLEPWEKVTITPEEIEEVGDHVLATVRQRAVGEGSGAATEFSYFQLWTLRAGRIVRLQNFRERDSALAAAGAA